MKLHFRTDQPAASAASIHRDGCRHANLKPRVIIDLDCGSTAEALEHPEVLDLIARAWPVALAPCTKGM